MDGHGTWKVTTEGDCEGRSITQLGVFYGYIDDIAFFLAKKCYYVLEFEEMNIIDDTDKTPNDNEVVVRIRKNGFKGNVKKYEAMLANRDVFVSSAKYYESVKFSKKNPISEEEMQANEAVNLLKSNGFDVDAIRKFI